jgi:hypothetical protein
MKKISLPKGGHVLVDDEDYAILSKHTLIKNLRSGLVMITLWVNNQPRYFPVSHVVKSVNGSCVVVYDDGNHMNLQKNNLLVVPRSVFNHKYSNSYSKRGKTSKYRGISKSHVKSTGQVSWKAQIMHQGVRYEKRFKYERHAVNWWNDKARELFGEHAYQNKLEDIDENTICT